MRFPSWLSVYGNQKFRGLCPRENHEQVTFFNWIRSQYPDSYGLVAIHIKNEGKRSFSQTRYQKAEGLTAGACDIIVPGRITFACELKRQDHTKSKFQDNQLTYLKTCHDTGAFTCVALGSDGAKEAFKEYLTILEKD